MLLVFHDYTYDDIHRELRRGAEPVKADPQHLNLLALFLEHPGELLSREQIIEAVWDGRAVAENVLSVAIAKLRKVLGHREGQREYIENRYGRGYRFLPRVTRVSEAALPGPTGGRAHALPRSPLVGRDETLEQLRALASSAQLGQGAVAIISGEPGIGKTRLAEALEGYARKLGLTSAWGRSQSEVGAPPLWPMLQIIRELAGQGSIDPPPPERTGRATRGEERASPSTTDELAHRLLGALRCSTSVDHHTLDDLAQRIFRASRRQPLLLLIDDIQWADSASLRLLSYLIDEIPRWPIFVLATLRSTELPDDGKREHDLSRVWNHRNCRRIELARLRPEDVEEYVSATLGEAVPALALAVFTRSEGNPFFMVDLLRGVERGGSLLQGDMLQPSGLALDIVRQRLQGLADGSRRVLSAAAVIGRNFDVGLLSYVSEREPDELLEALDGSLANDTVVASSEMAGGYAFDHELIREVLCAELSTVERGRLHLRAGEGLLRRRAAGGRATNAELAHHFLSAQPQGDVERAIAYTQAAATDASRLAAHADARALLQRALDVQRFRIAPRPETHTALLLQLAFVERILGAPSYLEHLKQAVALAREHRLGKLLTLAGGLLSPAPGVVVPAEATDVLEAARDVLEPSDHKNQAIVRAHLAWTPPNCHSARRVRELLVQAEALATEARDPSAKAAVRDAQLFFGSGPDTHAQAELIAREIERDLVENPETALQARRMLVAAFRLITSMQRGDRAAVSRALEARAAILPRLNNVELSWHQERILVVERMNHGDFTRVKDDLLALRERASRFELQAYRTLWALDFGVYLVRTSDASALAERIRPSLALGERDAPAIRSRKIRSMVEFGFLDDVRVALDQIPVDTLDDLPRDRDYLAVLSQLAFGSAAAGSRAHCETLYRLLSPYAAFYAVGISYHCDGAVATHLGALARTLGRDAQARQHLEQGLKHERAFDLAPAAAQTAFDLAALLAQGRQGDDPARATQLFDEALRDAERMGMNPLAAAARAKLSGRARPRAV